MYMFVMPSEVFYMAIPIKSVFFIIRSIYNFKIFFNYVIKESLQNHFTPILCIMQKNVDTVFAERHEAFIDKIYFGY